MNEQLATPSTAGVRLTVDLEIQPNETPINGYVTLIATPSLDGIDDYEYFFYIQSDPLKPPVLISDVKKNVARWRAAVDAPRSCLAKVKIVRKKEPSDVKCADEAETEVWIKVTQELATSGDVNELRDEVNSFEVPRVLRGSTVPVSGTISLSRAQAQLTGDQVVWAIIRDRTSAISFPRYKRFIDRVMNDRPLGRARGFEGEFQSRLPFPGVAAYGVLKAATELFLMQECGIVFDENFRFSEAEESARFGRPVTHAELDRMRNDYLSDLQNENAQTLPYFELIRERLGELDLKPVDAIGPDGYGILRSRFTMPCMIELIWSYWHEEGMQVQTMNAISSRFQNKRTLPNGRDPLTHFDIDPLRGLSNFLWGYVQDEQHRLSVLRRAYEYDHEYGLRLYGKAVKNFAPVDSRSKFLEAFHNLLYRTALFYKEDDDTTVIADGFEILNALREVHLVLAHGAHNQFGDLPSTARQEMLIEQWLLARPEMREFLGGKIMVPYAEPWMDRVDTVKSLFNWTDTSITYFHDLAVHGEQLLLSVRYGNWSQVNDVGSAANWARYWRPEVQRYIHAYRAVTGVDLTLEMVDSGRADERFMQPSVHLRNRIAQQQSGGALPAGSQRALGPAGSTVSGGAARDALIVRDRD